MRVFALTMTLVVVIAVVSAKRSHKKDGHRRSFKDGVDKENGMVLDYGKNKKENKMARRRMKLNQLLPVVDSPDSPYKQEWKRITQYQEGIESIKCQELRCKKKEVCLLDKETQVAECITKKELKKAKKLVKKYYEKQSGIDIVESQHSPDLAPMQTHKKHKKNKKNKEKKHKKDKKWKGEKGTHIKTSFDHIGEESFHSEFVEGKKLVEAKTGVTTKDNEVGSSLVQVSQKKCGKKELREIGQRLVDWFHAVQQSLDPDDRLEEAKDQLLIQKPNRKPHHKKGKKERKEKKEKRGRKEKKDKRERGEKKWKKEKRGRRKPRDVSRAPQQCECRDPVTWEFLHLDTDNSTALSHEELKAIGANPFEHCVGAFVDKCDLDASGDLSYPEWCCCFKEYLPPCFDVLRKLPTQMIQGQVIVMPGTFVPRCTAQGFFVKQQCDQKQCWCVDDLGTEQVGSRIDGKVDCGQ